MLDVVSTVGEDRVRYRCAMASRTVRMQVHTVGCVMINVMGKEVKRRTVIDIAMTTGTVTSDQTALECTVSVMTYRTGIMLDVVGTIYKGLTGSYGRAMAACAVSSQRHVTGCSMIDGVIIPGAAAMTRCTDRTAAGTR